MTPPVCYTCVTNGYDDVAPAPGGGHTRFIMYHDGSVRVPPGWQGIVLSVPGLSGVALNRYAKMLPHRLDLPSSRSLYIDGNMYLRVDPAEWIDDTLSRHSFAAMAHPELDCAYAEIARTLRLGFVWPGPARRAIRLLQERGVPPSAGLFECGILFRRLDDPSTVALCEAWWEAWQLGFPRDQALLVAAAHQTGIVPASLGVNDVHGTGNKWIGIRTHRSGRPRRQRLPRRIASEASLYRIWARP